MIRTDLRPNAFDGIINNVVRLPAGIAARHIQNKSAKDFLTGFGVRDLRMELDTVIASALITHRCDGRPVRRALHFKARRNLGNAIAMTHPHHGAVA